MEEKILVERCWSGDIDAFTALVEQYHTMAVRTAYLITGRRDMAEDMAQEAFIQCFYSLKKLKDADRFKSWLYKILVRTSWKMAKKRGEKLFDTGLSGEIAEDIPDRHDFTEDIETKQLYDAVYQAVNELRDPLKAAAVLHYFNHFTIREIAEVLGCREGTVKSRLYSARKNIAEDLKKKGWDSPYILDVQAGRESGFHAGAGAS